MHILAHLSTQSGGTHLTRSDPASSVQLRTNFLTAVASSGGMAWNAWSTVVGFALSGRSTNSLESLKMAASFTARSKSPEQNTSLGWADHSRYRHATTNYNTRQIFSWTANYKLINICCENKQIVYSLHHSKYEVFLSLEYAYRQEIYFFIYTPYHHEHLLNCNIQVQGYTKLGSCKAPRFKLTVRHSQTLFTCRMQERCALQMNI